MVIGDYVVGSLVHYIVLIQEFLLIKINDEVEIIICVTLVIGQ